MALRPADPAEPHPCQNRRGSGELVLEPDLIDAETAATIVGVARRTWYRYVDNGDVPQPVRFGGSVKWRREEIDEWIRAGCPRVRKDGES
ncbi:MAG: helix-turn-helix transcriptional regulator [Planctomycetia bacterium]|jgi:prophage regulatory protein